MELRNFPSKHLFENDRFHIAKIQRKKSGKFNFREKFSFLLYEFKMSRRKDFFFRQIQRKKWTHLTNHKSFGQTLSMSPGQSKAHHQQKPNKKVLIEIYFFVASSLSNVNLNIKKIKTRNSYYVICTIHSDLIVLVSQSNSKKGHKFIIFFQYSSSCS